MTPEPTTTRTATFVRDLSDKFKGTAYLYKVDPPVPYDYDFDTEEYQEQADYVVASAAVVPFSGPETYLFPANVEGEVVDWSELNGSERGTLDCDAAVRRAGYEVRRDS